MQHRKITLHTIFRYLGLLLLLLWSGFPILFLFLSSLKHPTEIFSYPPSFIFLPTFDNFVSLFQRRPQILVGLKNSIVVTLFSSLFTAVLSTPAGYALSRNKGRLFDGTAFFMLLIRMYPPIVITLPLFPVFSQLGLDNIWGLIILYSALYISLSSWLMKIFIDDIPIEMEEAAEIDGANLYQKLTRIILPMSKQGIITSVIFVSIFAWKEFTFAYIFAGSGSRTAPMVLNQLLDAISGVQWGPLFAASVLQVLPLMILIVVLQNYFIEGLSRSGIKG